MSAEQANAGRESAAGRDRGGTLAPLTLHVLRTQARGAVIWAVVLGLYGAAIMAIYPSIAGTPQLDQVLDAYPAGIKEAFGITSLTDVGSYLDSQIFSVIVPIALSFFPILAASGAIAGAEERGTIDVLLGNPVPRWHLVAGYALSTALALAGILAALAISLWVPAWLLGVDFPLSDSFAAAFNLWPLCAFFGALAMLCSALCRRRALSTAIPGAVLLTMYLVDVLGGLLDPFESLRHLSVFYYYGSALQDGVDRAGSAGVAAAALALVVLAALLFGRRDIYA